MYLHGMYRATVFLVLGFLLFLSGFIALILMMVSLQLSFLVFIDSWGRTAGLVIRLLMIFGGVMIMYIARGKFQK